MTLTGPATRSAAPAKDGFAALSSLSSLPNLVVIGAMKCGTTALHHCLGAHPDIGMSQQKELNFFFGPADPLDHCATGPNWYRGLEWYAGQFDPTAEVRGESSPGYTSPDHPEVAARMAAVVPSARLIYLVRDPLERAVSQYRHHVADGHETRPYEQALLAPASQYVTRGRYWDRLVPFLEQFPPVQICIVAQEQLRADPRRVLAQVFRFLDVDDTFWCAAFESIQHRANGTAPPVELDEPVRERLVDALRDDVDRLRALAGQDFPEWNI